VEASTELLFHAWPCGISDGGSKTAFAGEDKVLAKCGPEKSAAILETCPKNGTGGYSISPDDLDANEKEEKPPGSDVGRRKGIQATT
jgi:hypothetical protein